MKVALIGTRGYPSHYGGFETAVRHIAPYLTEKGHVVTVYGWGTGWRAATRETCGVRVVNTPGSSSKALGTLSHSLTATIHCIFDRPDAVLAMNVATGWWMPLLRMRGIPVICNVDGIEWQRKKWSMIGRIIFFLSAVMTALMASAIVVDSVVIGKYWSRLFHRQSVFIPYGGTFDEDLPRPAVAPSGPYVLAVARLVPENTIREFLQALEYLDEDISVVLVGSGLPGDPIENEVRQAMESRPGSSWTGHIADDVVLHGLWKHSSVYFHGHSVGGTNPALVQAMATGSSIVARDTAFNREVLGEAALFVAPKPKAIADSIRRLFYDERLQAGLRSQSLLRARENYTWDGVCEAYENVLVAQQRGPKRY